MWKNRGTWYFENRNPANQDLTSLGLKLYHAVYFNLFCQQDRVPFLLRMVLNILDLLPLSRSNIFISYVINHHRYTEIAEACCISINAVKNRMKRSYAIIFENTNSYALPLVLLFLNKTHRYKNVYYVLFCQ